MSDGQITLPVGALLRERYIIKSILNSEATGTIYLVRDQQEKTIKYHLLALKEYTGLDQQTRYQLTFNGTALRQLQHQALPHIQHVFNDDKRGCVYVVLDYIEGINLETLRRQHPAQRLGWRELRPFAETILNALTYLHHQEKPLFHGDIKPTNIGQSTSGKVMLLDLGYAQTATTGRLPQPATTLSSYRAPEQLTGEIDQRSDVYGLGATLYTLLTGQEPADALTRLGSFNKKKSDPLPLASKVTPEVPRPLAEVLQKALALDPAERFASARDFWQALSVLPIPEEAATPLATDQQKTPAPVSTHGTAPVRSTEQSSNGPVAHNGKQRRALLPLVAILCGLLLLGGAGTGVWISLHNQTSLSGKPISSSHPGIPEVKGSTPTSNAAAYLSIVGTYQGTLTFVTGRTIFFTLKITHQVQDRYSGTFTSPQQSGTVTGTIDLAKDIEMTVIDSSNNAVFDIFGGFNGIPQAGDSAGGGFTTCAPEQGPYCHENHGNDSAGNLALNFISSATLISSLHTWS
jgi:serine/threonine protein kinase